MVNVVVVVVVVLTIVMGEDEDDDDRDDQDDSDAIKCRNEKTSIQPSVNRSNKPECQCMRKFNVIVRL